MADQIDRRNQQARARAERLGRLTFTVEVVDYWPGCTTCGQQIRSRGLALYRGCGCPGVRWYPTGFGWRRETNPTTEELDRESAPTPATGEEPTHDH